MGVKFEFDPELLQRIAGGKKKKIKHVIGAHCTV
jgi:hypothetical protein